MKINIVWLRRDLRLNDNIALNYALKQQKPILLIFIFDENILEGLNMQDARVEFIHSNLRKIDYKLKKRGTSLKTYKGKPLKIWQKIIDEFDVDFVFFNRDYEPYAKKRDNNVSVLLKSKNKKIKTFNDQLIFEPGEILKKDNSPYTIFTPFKKQWLKKFAIKKINVEKINIKAEQVYQNQKKFPLLNEIGFKETKISVPKPNYENIKQYEKYRDFPAIDKTTHLSTHLRFGTVSVREVVNKSLQNPVFLSEIIWREFFMNILFFFPDVVMHNFKRKYDNLEWRNNEKEFELWCKGETGYPIVDAGMKQLSETGFMHNRVRMIVASFLTKHLLIDWRWGESFFAEKLIDYELSSNNGNWQWAASTGSDAVPYFRIFNPLTQQKKFDSNFEYIKNWLPEFSTTSYKKTIVNHKIARQRALDAFKTCLNENL